MTPHDVHRLAQRIVLEVGYLGLLVALGVALGQAFGAWVGVLAALVGIGVPAGAMFRRDLDDRSIAKDRAVHSPDRPNFAPAAVPKG